MQTYGRAHRQELLSQKLSQAALAIWPSAPAGTHGQTHRRELLGQPFSHRRKSWRPMGERIGKNPPASHFRIGASHGDLWASASAKTPQPDIFTSRTGHMDERTGGSYSAEHCRMDGWQKRPAALARRQQRPATMANRSAPAHRLTYKWVFGNKPGRLQSTFFFFFLWQLVINLVFYGC
jgi:hypothetical protein